MRAGTVAVIGKANAGKSTLINVMVGEKVAIVSPKPQTTRDRILGVLTRETHQIVFVDTPGIYKASNVLTDIMMKTTETSAKDVDLILYVVDGHTGIARDDLDLMKRFFSSDIPMLIAFTKTDIMPAEKIPEEVVKIAEAGIDADVFPVSARKYRNVKALENEIANLLPEGDKVFEEDIVSDKSERFMIREIMREKILLKYDKEIPHGVAIVVTKFEKRPTGNLYDVDIDIVCEKQNHKAILIGKGGKALKETAAFARQDMEKFLDAKVFLTTYVKVEEGWRDRQKLIREFGYDEEQN
ncbi:MAG: GTPase Era [Clostridia bacterium]|nr:GTPase Era [Clostridia bacterium]